MARTIGLNMPERHWKAIRKAGLRLIFEQWLRRDEPARPRGRGRDPGWIALQPYQHQAGIAVRLVQDHVNELLRQLDRALQDKKRRRKKLRAFVAFHAHLPHEQEARGLHRQFRTAQPGAKKTTMRSWRCAAPMRHGWREFSPRAFPTAPSSRRCPGGDVCDHRTPDRTLRLVPGRADA